MKPLKPIPKDCPVAGLEVFCNHSDCQTNIKSHCKSNHLSLEDCAHPECLRYKIYFHLSGTKNKRITKTFESRNYKTVLKEATKFKETLKQGGSANVLPPPELKERKQVEIPAVAIDNLLPLMAKYLTFISGDISIPLHLRKSRSTPYVSEIERCFKILIDLLKKERYHPDTLKIGDIEKNIVGKFFEYLQSEKKLSNRSINKQVSFLRTFYHWIVKHEGIQVNNPFAFVVKLPEYSNPLAITNEEFQKVLEVTTPEKGMMQYGGVKEWRNMYRPWLKDAFKLALFTGRRREEIINFMWRDIIKDKSGTPILISSADRKVNNIQHRTEEGQKKINYIPITAELYQLLLDLGYEKFKGSDQYILAPQVNMQRNKSMADAISRSFSHFFKLSNPARKLKFKSIRKAYLTSMQVRTGDAKIVSGHSGNAVLEKHYFDKAVIAQSLRDFSVFGNKELERNTELATVREKHKNQEQNISLEK